MYVLLSELKNDLSVQVRLSLPIHRVAAIAVFLSGTPNSAFADTKDLEFVAEHLPETAMDQRFSALPLFGGKSDGQANAWQLGLGLSRTRSGSEQLSGALFSIGVERRLNPVWSVSLFAFFDDLEFRGSPEQRPLAVGFSRDVPLQLPAEALVSGLRGRARDLGGGVLLRRQSDGAWLGRHEWLFGIQWQRLELRDYASRFEILSGADAGVTGLVDYSHDYSHFTPLAGLAWPRQRGAWSWTPHLLAAIPRPVRGVAGRITAPGIDVSGDTDSAGNGKHFGDPFVAAGLVVGYLPWHVTMDIGAVLTQQLLEPRIHKGIDSSWLLSLGVGF